MKLLVNLHRLLRACYPAGFRAQFGAEMETVFEVGILAAKDNPQKLLVLFGREIRDWPGSLLREYWDAWRHKEISMVTNLKQPAWYFYAAWILLSTLAIPLALALTFAVLALITDQIGGIILVNGQQRTTEDYLFLFVFVPLFWLLTSFVQYLLLRRYLPQMGWWIAATGLGWLSALASMQVFDFLFDSVFLSDWGFVFGFTLIGTLIGFCQWLLLRRRITQATWWILASMGGWGLAALGTFTSVKNGSIWAQLLVVGLSPAIITSFAWWYLWKRNLQPQNSVFE